MFSLNIITISALINIPLICYLIARAALAMSKTPLTRVRHLKRGTTYDIMTFAIAQTSAGITDNERVFVYVDVESEEVYIRPESEFNDGRFEVVK